MRCKIDGVFFRYKQVFHLEEAIHERGRDDGSGWGITAVSANVLRYWPSAVILSQPWRVLSQRRFSPLPLLSSSSRSGKNEKQDTRRTCPQNSEPARPRERFAVPCERPVQRGRTLPARHLVQFFPFALVRRDVSFLPSSFDHASFFYRVARRCQSVSRV